MDRDRGVALVLVLSILAVAGIMAVAFVFTARLELKAAHNYLEGTKASYLAEAGVSYAQAVLKQDPPDIDSFEDSWHNVFEGTGVDNDGDGELDSRWINMYDDKGDIFGRYAVLVKDEASLLNINIATKSNVSPLKVTEGWTPYELDLEKFLTSFGLQDPQKLYEDILAFRYGPDGSPGGIDVDDNGNQRVLGCDGIDNNGDGLIDEPGEGIDEPMEFVSESSYGDDNPFETPFELARIKSVSEKTFNRIYPYITSYSVDRNVDVKGVLRENINFLDAQSLLVLLQEAGVQDPFQKAVNIADACDEDFSQSVITKSYSRLSIVDKGQIGDWVFRDGCYESSIRDGAPLRITLTNLPEGEYYIGVFGVKDGLVGDVTINGMSQDSVRDGDILRVGALLFENGVLSLTIKNSEEEDVVCFFSHLELYPRLGQKGFSSIVIKGVEGIRINEIMVKPVITRKSFSGHAPGGDWVWQDGYYKNEEPKGGKAGEGTWVWQDVPNGKYYVRLFAGVNSNRIGDVEIEGYHSQEVSDGDLFGNGRVVSVSGGKIIVRVQNNYSYGEAYFGSIKLSQQPDGEYIELVNLTPRDVNIGGWSVVGPSKEGWPAAIPLGTVIERYGYLVLCVDKYDLQMGIDNNGVSFTSIWGKEHSAELHFLKPIMPGSDLLSDNVYPEGNVITLKDSMGHIVDQVEYFVGAVSENRSLELSDPSYIADSNSNSIRDSWYLSKAEKGGTPGFLNDNIGMEEEKDGQVVKHDVREVNVENINFSSVGKVAFVPLSTNQWKTIPILDVSKIADRLTVFGIRLEAEEHIVEGSGWNVVDRPFPMTDYFESGEIDSIGIWHWDKNDGVENGYYKLRIFGEEGEEIAVSLLLSDGTWTAWTPPLSPGPRKDILLGNIEIGTGSKISTPEGVLELKIKNVSRIGASHFDFVRLDPINAIQGRININTATKKVLGVLPGVNEDIVDRIIDNRVFGNKNGLELGIGDLLFSDVLGSDELTKKKNFKQIANLVTVHSDVYRIIVTAQILEKGKMIAEKKIWTVFER